MKLLNVPPSDTAEYSMLPEACRSEVADLLRAMGAICGAMRGQIQNTIAAEARRLGLSKKRLRTIWDAFRKSGDDWRTLINRAKYPDARDKLSAADIALFQTYAERNQRKTAPAHRSVISDWRKGLISTSTPFNPRTRLPAIPKG